MLSALAVSASGCSRRGNEARAKVETAPRLAGPAASTATDPETRGPGGQGARPPVPAPAAPACGDAGSIVLLVSPERPIRAEPLRVIAVADRYVDAQLSVASTDRHSPAAARDAGASVTEGEAHGGPPYAWVAQIDAPAAGSWSAQLTRAGACDPGVLGTKNFTVAKSRLSAPVAPRTVLWTTRQEWSADTENLYSAWIEHLFEAPLEEQPSWTALHEVLRDRARNFLFDYLGASEDEQGVVVRPDCADLPYFLRAYFAFKLGLPFGWSDCTRGGDGEPPQCAKFATNEDPFPPTDAGPQTLPAWAKPDRRPTGPWENNTKRLGELFRTTLADAVQSGAGRTPEDAEESDYYPVTLSVETLRPGTIFADPYGHVLVISSRIPETATAAGVLLAVDGQPDGTVARKRFWRGNFLFAIDPALGGAGFKRFRPVVRDRASGHLVHAKNADLPDYSATDQVAGGVEGFYDKVEDVLSPVPLSPMLSLLDALQALQEQVTTRVHSIDNARSFLATGGPVVDMPEGEKIFDATGHWEDFSTPSRDLRLLIAIDVVRALPARFVRRSEGTVLPGVPIDQLRRQLEDRLARELRERTFEYVRSDGSAWKLSLQDVVDRQEALEMAYNPNDCVEKRWGAPAGSAEAATCKAEAPAEQVEKMAEYRPWFHDRKRPAR